MVLRGVLENLLHGAGTARGVDNAALGNGQNTVLADTVVEILGYVGSKGCGRFMTVEPCGYAQALVLCLGEALHHFEGGVEPERMVKGGGLFQNFQRCFQFCFCLSGHPRTQMGGFHRSGTSTADHQKALFGELFAEADDLPVTGIRAFQTVTAHDAHNAPFVVLTQKLMQGVADGMVVQGACQSFFNVNGR